MKVTIPDSEMDRPRFARLAVIALVCFAAGLIWPELLGKSLVQRPPGSEKKEEKEDREETAPPSPGVPSPGAPLPAGKEDGALSAPVLHVAPLTTSETARVTRAVVASCRSTAGARLQACDEPRTPPALTNAMEKLATCDAAEGAEGLLSLGLELDFSRGRVARAKAGQSTTLPADTASALIACAQSAIVGTTLESTPHEHAAYWVYYMVEFTPPGSSAPPEVVPASGQGTIGWKTAVVRQEPSRKGKVMARLLYGTRVKVSGRAGDWYRIDVDGRGSTGWVHRNALGL